MDIDAEKLSELPVSKAWIGLTYGTFAIKFGPYPPEKVGGFLTRLMDEHQGPHPFFFSLECNPVEDPVPHLLDLARPDEEPEADTEEQQS